MEARVSLPKGKSHRSKSEHCEMEDSQGERKSHLGEKKRFIGAAWSEKSEFCTAGKRVPKRRENTSK